jgi:hypothetical protein
MKFFKYYDPFVALIVAKDRDQADGFYSKIILLNDDADNEESKKFESAMEINYDQAFRLFENTIDSKEFEKGVMHWSKLMRDYIQSHKAKLILIDSDLI